MLSLVEQAFVGRDEKRAPLKTPAWEAYVVGVRPGSDTVLHLSRIKSEFRPTQINLAG